MFPQRSVEKCERECLLMFISPSSVGGIEDEAGVVAGAHKLWPSDACNFWIYIGGFNREGLAFGQQVANVGQEFLGFVRILRLRVHMFGNQSPPIHTSACGFRRFLYVLTHSST